MWEPEEVKRHEPTPRRLAQLQQAGAAARGPALTAAAVLGGLGLGGWLGGGWLLEALKMMLARDLQQGAQAAANREGLTGLMAAHLALTTGVLALCTAAAVLLFALSEGLQRRLMRPGAGAGAVLWPTPERRRALGRPGGTPGEALAGVALMGVLAWQALALLGRANGWEQLAAAPVWGELAGRGLALLGGVGALQWLGRWQRLRRRAMMSDRELAEEQRQTEGPPLTRQRRAALRRKGR